LHKPEEVPCLPTKIALPNAQFKGGKADGNKKLKLGVDFENLQEVCIKLDEFLGSSNVILLVGKRQSGLTTLVNSMSTQCELLMKTEVEVLDIKSDVVDSEIRDISAAIENCKKLKRLMLMITAFEVLQSNWSLSSELKKIKTTVFLGTTADEASSFTALGLKFPKIVNANLCAGRG
jgi:hypothetical protein